MTISKCNGRMDGRMDGRMNGPKPVCPLKVFEVGGIAIYYFLDNVSNIGVRTGSGSQRPTHMLIFGFIFTPIEFMGAGLRQNLKNDTCPRQSHKAIKEADLIISSPEPKAHWWAYRIGRPPSSVICRPSSVVHFSSETAGPIEVKFHMELL